MGTVVVYVKLFKRKPEKVYKWEAMEEDDVECGNGSANFPMVLVQIPMYNEKEVMTLASEFLYHPSDWYLAEVFFLVVFYRFVSSQLQLLAKSHGHRIV